MGRVLRTNRARRDLLDLWAYVATDSAESADEVLHQIDQSCRSLAEFPEMGRRRDELGSSVRSFPIGNYVIYYRKAQSGIPVLRVLHGARDIRSLR